MNRKQALVTAAVLLLLAALYLILRPDGSHDPDSTGGDGKVTPPVRIRPGNPTGADGAGGGSKEVSLPGLPPVRYSGRRDVTMEQLLQKFDAIDELFPESMNFRNIRMRQPTAKAVPIGDGNVVGSELLWRTVRGDGGLALPYSSERPKTNSTHCMSCLPPTGPHTRRFSAMRSFEEDKSRDSSR